MAFYFNLYSTRPDVDFFYHFMAYVTFLVEGGCFADN